MLLRCREGATAPTAGSASCPAWIALVANCMAFSPQNPPLWGAIFARYRLHYTRQNIFLEIFHRREHFTPMFVYNECRYESGCRYGQQAACTCPIQEGTIP